MANHKALSLAELNDLLYRVQATLELLVGTPGRGAKAAQATGRGKAKAKAPTRTRAGAAKLREKLLGVLKAGKGLQFGDVVKRAGAAPGQVQYHLQALRSKKKVRVQGKRSAARWFAA
jgi:hypothetical protein